MRRDQAGRPARSTSASVVGRSYSASMQVGTPSRCRAPLSTLSNSSMSTVVTWLLSSCRSAQPLLLSATRARVWNSSSTLASTICPTCSRSAASPGSAHSRDPAKVRCMATRRFCSGVMSDCCLSQAKAMRVRIWSNAARPSGAARVPTRAMTSSTRLSNRPSGGSIWPTRARARSCAHWLFCDPSATNPMQPQVRRNTGRVGMRVTAGTVSPRRRCASRRRAVSPCAGMSWLTVVSDGPTR